MKKERPGNSLLATNLLHEALLHRQVQAAFDQYDNLIQSKVHVPRVHGIMKDDDDQFWEQYLHKFPATHCQRATLVQMERILPLPKIVGKALITQFYADQWSEIDSQPPQDMLEDVRNKHCLVRIYLGKQNRVIFKENFLLRNFPLYLEPIERLGLDVAAVTFSMGKAFALMHWGAGVNGDDVEFVLGTSLVSHPGNKGDDDSELQHRAVGLYLLDFGQCDLVDLAQDPRDVFQAFKGAMVTGDNQLFIPHYRKSPDLFARVQEGIHVGRQGYPS
jgi:hypothetical protein